MSLFLFIGDKQFSSWSMRARIALIEKQLEYEEILIPLDYHVRVTPSGFESFPLTRPDPATGCMCEKSQLFFFDPTGLLESSYIPAISRVPILCETSSGTVIPELLAICEYLDEKYVGGDNCIRYLPEDIDKRASIRSFSNLICFDYMQLHEEMSYPKSFRAPDISKLSQDSADQVEEFVIDLKSVLVRNNVSKDNQYLFGDFGLADIIMSPFPQTFRGWSYDFTGNKIVEDYFEKLRERPSIKQHIDEAWQIYRSRTRFTEGSPAWIAHHYRFQENFRIIHNFRSEICHKLENNIAWEFFINAYEGCGTDEIVERASNRYAVSKERIRQDVKEFFESISPDRDATLLDREFFY